MFLAYGHTAYNACGRVDGTVTSYTEDPGSHPVIGNFFFLIVNRKYKKRPGDEDVNVYYYIQSRRHKHNI